MCKVQQIANKKVRSIDHLSRVDTDLKDIIAKFKTWDPETCINIDFLVI